MDTPTPQKVQPEPAQDAKILGAVSYLWVLSILILVLKKNDPFVQFHAKQGTLLFLISIVAWVIPPIATLLQIALFVLVVFGFLQAMGGKYWALPYIGKWAEKIKL